MKKTIKQVKPAAKSVVAAKRPRTYKKSDLPRTARAYLGKTYGIYMDKENEAVARLIELHEERKKELKAERRAAEELASQYFNRFSDPARNAFGQSITPYEEALPKKPTLREQFLAWLGVKA